MGETCSVMAPELSSLPNGLYRWHLLDYGASGYGTWTGWQEFTLNISIPVVVLGEPSGELPSWDGSFHWTGVADATYYYLQVQNADGEILLGRWNATEVACVGETCSVMAAELSSLPNGLYRWRIQDYGPYGFGTWTQFQEFTLNR